MPKISAKSYLISIGGEEPHAAKELAQKLMDQRLKLFVDYVYLYGSTINGIFFRHPDDGWHHRKHGHFSSKTNLGKRCERVFAIRHKLMTLACQMALQEGIPYEKILDPPWSTAISEFGFTGFMFQGILPNTNTFRTLFKQEINEILQSKAKA